MPRWLRERARHTIFRGCVPGFEIEETDVYLTVRETLLRRCGAWAAARGLAMAPSLAEALLDSRHFGTDGRLGY